MTYIGPDHVKTMPWTWASQVQKMVPIAQQNAQFAHDFRFFGANYFRSQLFGAYGIIIVIIIVVIIVVVIVIIIMSGSII